MCFVDPGGGYISLSIADSHDLFGEKVVPMKRLGSSKEISIVVGWWERMREKGVQIRNMPEKAILFAVHINHTHRTSFSHGFLMSAFCFCFFNFRHNSKIKIFFKNSPSNVSLTHEKREREKRRNLERCMCLSYAYI